MPTPLPTIANTYRCALNWRESSTGQTATNVIHIRKASVTPLTVHAELLSAWQGMMYEACASTAAVEDFAITPLDGGSATEHFPGSTGWFGGTGGQWIPGASAVVSFQTTLRGRANRGRVFLPFLTEAACFNGSMGGTFPSDMATAWTAFKDQLITDSYELGVASYDRAHHGAGAAFNGVTTLYVKAAYGSQRRRQERIRYP